jgi:hypothetical protein
LKFELMQHGKIAGAAVVKIAGAAGDKIAGAGVKQTR